jgi:hypothetical protein
MAVISVLSAASVPETTQTVCVPPCLRARKRVDGHVVVVGQVWLVTEQPVPQLLLIEVVPVDASVEQLLSQFETVAVFVVDAVGMMPGVSPGVVPGVIDGVKTGVSPGNRSGGPTEGTGLGAP